MTPEDYLDLLSRRLERALDLEEDRLCALRQEREILTRAFGPLAFLDAPRDWFDNPQIRERLALLGLKPARNCRVQTNSHQPTLRDLHDQVSLLQWVKELAMAGPEPL